MSRKRKREGEGTWQTILSEDFVHPAGPGELPWAWRLADTLSTPTKTAPALFAQRRSLPQRLLEQDAPLPWAWRLPFD